MTHLVIENQNSNTEIVSAAIILKLYEMALSAEGDVSLKGNLLSDHAKLTAYEYLTGNLTGTSTKRFPNLSLNITGGLYIDFADPEVERVLKANNVGDGDGITSTDLSNINDVSYWFRGNTVITHFDEFGNTNDVYVGERHFKGCTNLISIDTSKVVLFGRGAFADCSSLLSIDLSRATLLMGNYANGGSFENCTSLTSVYAPLYTGQNDPNESRLFMGCTALTTVNLPLCTRIPDNCFSGCTALTTVNLPLVTTICPWAFNQCTSLGVGEDLDLDLDIISVSTGSFVGTGYRTVTLHETTKHSIANYSGSGQFDAFAKMPNLIKLDMSDTKLTECSSKLCPLMTTIILPETWTGETTKGSDWGVSINYIVLLATTPPANSYSLFSFYSNPSTCAVYVPDSAYLDYLTAWSDFPAGRIKPISELPSSVTWYTKEHPTT